MEPSSREQWESISQEWIAWTSLPDQDPYGEAVNLPALCELLPEPDGLTLDVGCGEGRVARMLQGTGHRVLGVDGSPGLASAAQGRGLAVAVADGTALPVSSGAAGIVVSSMVLMDVAELDGHLAELARVLKAGGSLVMAILHPICVSGFPMRDEYDTFALGDYLGPEQRNWVSSRNDRSIEYKFWHRPISEYLSAIGRAGLAVVDSREPQPSADFITASPDASQWIRVPMFLHVRAVKLG